MKKGAFVLAFFGLAAASIGLAGCPGEEAKPDPAATKTAPAAKPTTSAEVKPAATAKPSEDQGGW
jgi:hypothetical protein